MKKKLLRGIIILLFLQASVFLCYAGNEPPEINGVGIIPGVKNDKLYVKGIFPDSPAAKAGVQIGDFIESLKRFRDYENLEVYNWHNLNIALRSNPGTRIGLKLRRRGAVIEVNLVSEKIPLTYNNIPKTDSRTARILEYEKYRGKASGGSSEGVVHGDKYLIFNGREYLGIASIGNVSSDSSQVNAHGNFTDSSLSRLKGAELYFYESSPKRFSTYKKPNSITVHPDYRKYWQKVIKKECKIITGCKIMKIDRTTGLISIESNRGTVIDPPRGDIQYPAKQLVRVYKVKADFSWDRGKTEFLPAGSDRTIKEGDRLDIFYTEENGKRKACMIAVTEGK